MWSGARKVDDNQAAVVSALRAAGVRVQSLAAVGNGVPDLMCYFRKRIVLLEVKDGKKPPSARKLTEAEAVFAALWPVSVVSSVDEAFAAVGLRRAA